MSVPLKPLFRCDNQSSEKSCWQLASVVLDEGEEAYTTNLCQKCFNEALAGRRRRTTDKCAVETGGGKEGVPGKNVDVRKNHICVGCGNISPVKDRRQ